jgi:hypothetical protein
MKKITILFLLSVLFFSFHKINRKKIKPPGTVKIYDNFYVDETEVSNFSWKEFELSVSNKYGRFSKEHLAVIPDTNVWLKSKIGDYYNSNYYSAIAYRDYPVVGITHEQAIKFCEWRTERVKQFKALTDNKKINLTYRLPSEKEWEFLITNDKNLLQDSIIVNIVRKIGMSPQSAYSGYPNLFKLYNLIGNVAEMIDVKGVSKGGAYINLKEECLAGKQILYTEPTYWLGFRCVCDYIPEK